MPKNSPKPGREAQRDWHRLFGMLIQDYFKGLPYTVDVERDLSQQQQFLDVLLVRKEPGELRERMPDGMTALAAHNLITFKSHHEALDAWAIKELIGHYVAYRKLVRLGPSKLMAEDQFGLYAVCARFPHNLSGQVPWQQRQDGVYDCTWGTDTVRVIVAGQLARESQNAPLHLFSASTELASYGEGAYQRRSETTSLLLNTLRRRYEEEGLVMSYTLQDFIRDELRRRFEQMTPEDRKQLFGSIPLEQRLADASPDQIREYLDKLTVGEKSKPGKPRKPRKKE